MFGGIHFIIVSSGYNRINIVYRAMEPMSLSVSRYLTMPLNQLQRFAISFKSVCDNHVHRHVVLGVYYANRFGAIGLSRKQDLMNKPVEAKVSDK